MHIFNAFNIYIYTHTHTHIPAYFEYRILVEETSLKTPTLKTKKKMGR